MARIKSWNMLEASLALAAINAALNTPQKAAVLAGMPIAPGDDPEEANAFRQFLPLMEGKNVAVVGHFPNIERLRSHCRL